MRTTVKYVALASLVFVLAGLVGCETYDEGATYPPGYAYDYSEGYVSRYPYNNYEYRGYYPYSGLGQLYGGKGDYRDLRGFNHEHHEFEERHEFGEHHEFREHREFGEHPGFDEHHAFGEHHEFGEEGEHFEHR